ncbi:MAG: hypothetical protein M3O86_02300 [Actinomycetota bacterium]|nr:hypothetical protein [Actinomycetota bacterium]
MGANQPREREPDGSRRPEPPRGTRAVGPATRNVKPIIIAGAVVAVLAVAWAIFFSGMVL